jgi:NADPH:quinone reductase-like Zn-dependent oxidoreductase
VDQLVDVASRPGTAAAFSAELVALRFSITKECSMKAVVLTAYGDVDKLELRDLPEPEVEPNGLLIRMAGASINPVDIKMRTGAAHALFPVKFPGILGRDAAGEVLRVGNEVSGFAPGDRVLGLVHGAYAEQVAAPVANWVRVPPGMDLAEAGALPLVLLTGAQLMERAVAPSPEWTVLVTGAVGSVGRVALYAAQRRGVSVWAGVRASQREQAEHLGASGIALLDQANFGAELPRFDAIADTVGGDTIQRLYDCLKPGGTIGSVLGDPPGAKERGFVVHSFTAQPDSAQLERYVAHVAEGRLVVPITAKLPLSQAREAHLLVEKKRVGGKVLLLG